MSSRQPNTRLGRLREEAGWSAAQLAYAVSVVAAEHGHDLTVNRSTVTRWLAGARPRPPPRPPTFLRHSPGVWADRRPPSTPGSPKPPPEYRTGPGRHIPCTDWPSSPTANWIPTGESSWAWTSTVSPP
ncbi:helix-turn-helix domain-containing protein [Streptomyces sp. NPDC057307]|uniref:helix-turn-helix domain-containing protein n=1 Tax=Streptomyces sp. NPDC057307 TaxID=3346096 RepID=UPI00363C0CB6